jgi:hypothetical protein
MANLVVKDGLAATKYIKANGVGTDPDPFISHVIVSSGTVDTELTTADLDTGGGTDTRAVVGLVLAASGGGLLVGSANPMPVSDNGGSLTVDGTVAATQSGTWNVGTVTTVSAVTTVTTVTTVGTVTNVGTVAAVTAITNALPTGANTIGGVNLTQYTPVSGRLPVDPSGVTSPTKEVRASTVTITSPASNTSNVTLLAANANRLGVHIFNDSTAVMYIKLGTVASTTSYTHQLPSLGSWTVPFNYTGNIDAVWFAVNGSAKVSEAVA